MTRARLLADLIYRFKPLRTAAQAAVVLVSASAAGLLGVDWPAALSLAGAAGLVAFLQAWGDGSTMFAEKRPTAADGPPPRRAL